MTSSRPLLGIPPLKKAFIHICNILIASLFLLVLQLLAGIDHCGQVDLASAWSITLEVGVGIAKA
jgi:hypothetical protein